MDEAVFPAVRLIGVAKLYGSFAALRGISAEFPMGSSTVVVGENGAGKSTMLRTIAGLIAPSQGTVEVLGGAPHKQRRRIAYMSHDTMLYDELSGMENLQYFLRLYGGGDSCAEGCSTAAERALRSVGLDPALTRPVGQYSQGMRQRASLARVLQTDPEILLLDEPFSNMDVGSAAQMVKLLLEFRKWSTPSGHGRTLILTTHQASLAEPLAERTLQMQAGRIVGVRERTERTGVSS